MKTAVFNLALVVAGMSTMAAASASADPIMGVVTGGISHGGDDWEVARSANGNPVNIHGGGRFIVGLGAAWRPDQYPAMVSLVANYHVDPRAGGNTSATFTRFPVDAMVYYTGLEKLRVGVGLRYVLAPTVKAKVDSMDQTIKFKNALGSTLELGYETAPQLWLNLRLGTEKFKPKHAGPAREAEVSHLTVNLSYLF